MAKSMLVVLIGDGYNGVFIASVLVSYLAVLALHADARICPCKRGSGCTC